jgi:hypothetical protein
MARPKKTGLDYFPMDVVLADSVELLEAELGLEGFAILVKIWQKIYSNGYYIEWNHDVEILFARKINTEITKVNSVINACFRRNILDERLYNSYGVLTSKGIQRRFLKACTDSKRTYVPFIKELILVPSEITRVISEFISINSENLQNKPELIPKFEHEREREREREKEREKERIQEPAPEITKPADLDFISDAVWRDWVDYNEEKKHPLTKTQVNQQVQQLREWHAKGHDTEAIINTSICNGWKGFVAPKPKQEQSNILRNKAFGEDFLARGES